MKTEFYLEGDGIRNKNGYICFLTKPHHYQGQDERYKEEMAERDEHIKRILNGLNNKG